MDDNVNPFLTIGYVIFAIENKEDILSFFIQQIN